MYTYQMFINALSAHIIHMNLKTILYTHVERSVSTCMNCPAPQCMYIDCPFWELSESE